MAFKTVSYQQQRELEPLSIDGGPSEEALPPQPERPSAKRVLVGATIMAVCVVTLAAMIASTGSSTLLAKSKSSKPHTGDYCASAAKYTKENLKSLIDKPVAALLQSKDLKGQRKFEASDVLLKDGHYYAICDSSWSILKVREDLPTLSVANYHIGDPVDFDPTSESGFEGIFEDATTGDMFVVRESVDLSGFADGDDDSGDDDGGDDASRRMVRARRQLGLAAVTDDPSYHALVMQVNIDEDSEAFSVVDACPSEKEFDGDSKGFEGALSIRGADGVLYFLGLCEGNHCKEGIEGQDKGNGKVVVMARMDSTSGDDGEGVPGFDCYWKTVATLDLPSDADFQDYSAISLHRDTMHVAVTSQENSQVWVGKLEGGQDGQFDPAAAFFHEGGKVYDFPRNSNCEVQYCNVEGVYWVEGGSSGAGDDDDDDDDKDDLGGPPQVLVAVSDKMKGKGKQPYTCLEKDQSFHLFAIP
jgi:hypothetical protein